jgi:hypothetical protein
MLLSSDVATDGIRFHNTSDISANLGAEPQSVTSANITTCPVSQYKPYTVEAFH